MHQHQHAPCVLHFSPNTHNRWPQHVAALFLAGHMTVLAEVNCFDLSQMRPEPDAAEAAAWPRLAQLPPLLRLSELQMQDIAAGRC